MSLTCLLACCTLLKATSSIPLDQKHLTYLQTSKCMILQQNKDCRQRLGYTKWTKEDTIFELECKRPTATISLIIRIKE